MFGQSSCSRMDSKESESPGAEVEHRGTQCDYDFRWRNALSRNDAWQLKLYSNILILYTLYRLCMFLNVLFSILNLNIELPFE